jgi:hypothetical protein
MTMTKKQTFMSVTAHVNVHERKRVLMRVRVFESTHEIRKTRTQQAIQGNSFWRSRSFKGTNKTTTQRLKTKKRGDRLEVCKIRILA